MVPAPPHSAPACLGSFSFQISFSQVGVLRFVGVLLLRRLLFGCLVFAGRCFLCIIKACSLLLFLAFTERDTFLLRLGHLAWACLQLLAQLFASGALLSERTACFSHRLRLCVAI